jgi:hypothetical protein
VSTLYRILGIVRIAADEQKDLLQTISACFPVYGAEAVGERGDEFWDLIKTEVSSCHVSGAHADPLLV